MEERMFPFDVILFDVGKVLLTNGWDYSHRTAVADRFHLDIAVLEPLHLKYFDAWERGASTVKAYLDGVVFHEPRDFSQDEIFAFMLTRSVPIPDGAMGILHELAAADKCMLGALNNEARELNDYRFDHYGLREVFQVAFSSCYVGLRKPEPAIYRRTLDILGRPPERVLFIDDREQSIAGAQAAGMKTIQFTGADALRHELEALQVL
jgi:putative hydrolase of the HAD superfamily